MCACVCWVTGWWEQGQKRPCMPHWGGEAGQSQVTRSSWRGFPSSQDSWRQLPCPLGGHEEVTSTAPIPNSQSCCEDGRRWQTESHSYSTWYVVNTPCVLALLPFLVSRLTLHWTYWRGKKTQCIKISMYIILQSQSSVVFQSYAERELGQASLPNLQEGNISLSFLSSQRAPSWLEEVRCMPVSEDLHFRLIALRYSKGIQSFTVLLNPFQIHIAQG